MIFGYLDKYDLRSKIRMRLVVFDRVRHVVYLVRIISTLDGSGM